MPDPFFDTNIVIDWLKRRPETAVELSRYGGHRISRIVWTEVMAGEPPTSRNQVRRMIEHFEIVELDEKIAAAAADIRHLTRMKLLDAVILATARVNGAVLVTRNTKDFRPNMPGVHIPYTL